MALECMVERSEVVHKGRSIHQLLHKRQYSVGGKVYTDDADSLFHLFYAQFGSEKPKRFYVRPPWGYPSAILSLKFNSTGIIAAVRANGKLLVADPRVIGSIVQQSDTALEYGGRELTFMNDTQLVTGSGYSNIKLWDMQKVSEPFYVLVGHSNVVMNLEYDRARQWLYSSSYDGTVRMWDVTRLEASPKTIFACQFLFRMCMPNSGDALTFSVRGDELFSILPQEWYNAQQSALISADGGEILCQDFEDWHYTKFYIPTFEDSGIDPARIPAHLAWTNSPGGHEGFCHRVRLDLDPPMHKISSVCFNPAGEKLAMRGTRRLMPTVLEDIILTYQFSGCERCSVSECKSISHRVLSSTTILQQGKHGIIPGFSFDPIQDISFDPSGRYFVSPAHKDVFIFDSVTCSANIIGMCPGESQIGFVLTNQFSPNEPVIASGDTYGHIGFLYPR